MSGYNNNPTVFAVADSAAPLAWTDFDDTQADILTPDDVFQLLRSINDPEHPLTLEQLNVVNRSDIAVSSHAQQSPHLQVLFTPTIPHCSMATLIGLCIRTKLIRSLPPNIKVDIAVKPGTHQSENQINKQLNDKERVAAAMENAHLLQVVNQCLAPKDL